MNSSPSCWRTAITLVLLTATGGAARQTLPDANPAQPGPVSLAEQLELARLVDVAAQRLRLNIEYDPAVLKGSVTLRLGSGVTDAELWDLTNRQDWAACESVQRGLRSGLARPGPLSPEEDGVYQFVTRVARAYQGEKG